MDVMICCSQVTGKSLMKHGFCFILSFFPGTSQAPITVSYEVPGRLKKTQGDSSVYQDSIRLSHSSSSSCVSSTLENLNIKHGPCQLTPTANMESASTYSQLTSVEYSRTTIFLQISSC